MAASITLNLIQQSKKHRYSVEKYQKKASIKILAFLFLKFFYLDKFALAVFFTLAEGN